MSGRGRADQRVVPGLHPVRELLRAGVPVQAVHVADRHRAGAVLTDILELATSRRIPVVDRPRRQLDALTAGVSHQGVVAMAAPYRYLRLDQILARVPPGEPALLLALDGVTDPRNLGSLVRTAEAVGAHGVVIPSRRAVGVTPAVEKAAAGALAYLPVARVPNLARALEELAAQRLWSVGLDADGPVDLFSCDLLTEPIVVVVGAEGRGLSRLTATTCDLLVSLPMVGSVASLNASVACAVALYEVRRRRGQAATQP